MVIATPNLVYDIFGIHVFANLISLHASFDQLTHLIQNSFMKWCND